jgi:hypothetical protein
MSKLIPLYIDKPSIIPINSKFNPHSKGHFSNHKY